MKSNRVIQVSSRVWQQMTDVRIETARLSNRMIKPYLYFRKRNKTWPTQSQLKKHFATKCRLHIQTIQTLITRFFTNIKTTKTNRDNGDKHTRYPYKKKTYVTQMWKGQSIKRQFDHIILLMGGVQFSLATCRSKNLLEGKIVQTELTLSEISQLQSRCQKHSKRCNTLQKAKYKILNKAQNQSKDLFHRAPNEIVNFSKEKEISKLVVGDITEINRRKKNKASHKLSQEMGLLSLGLFVVALKYKLAAFGIELEEMSESYTSKIRLACSHKHKLKRGQYYYRRYKFLGIRDEVAINLLNKYLKKDEIKTKFLIPKGKIKYLRVVKIKSFARFSSATNWTLINSRFLC